MDAREATRRPCPPIMLVKIVMRYAVITPTIMPGILAQGVSGHSLGFAGVKSLGGVAGK